MALLFWSAEKVLDTTFWRYGWPEGKKKNLHHPGATAPPPGERQQKRTNAGISHECIILLLPLILAFLSSSLLFSTCIEYCLTYVPPSSPIQKVILIGACVAVSLLVLVVCLTVGLNWDEQMDLNISAAEDLVSVLHYIFLSCARQTVFWGALDIFRTVLLWLWSVLCLCSFSYPWQTYRPLKTLIFKQWRMVLLRPYSLNYGILFTGLL